ncbi:FAD-dependent oxidoreductase [Pseudomonas syringae]|uniref:FAD-dependent oxidoreductase n=1 Tax=Pseudomonas syringae TaxID=317 RepID=UPI002D1FA64F|nr:FAD-dependent oxidoreductase [Pseudomonas syringae]
MEFLRLKWVITASVHLPSRLRWASWLVSDSSEDQADVLVIGGGIHGLRTALHLVQVGVKVTLLEAAYCGRPASGVNAGGGAFQANKLWD